LRIVQVEVSNFRGIKQLLWHPLPGTNCLIGPGDSGKTSVLDAIELAFAARNSFTFDDTDFYGVDPKANPITITITIGDLPADFLKEDRYATYLRGWNEAGKHLEDEPDEGRLENTLSIRLTVDHSLEGEWRLYNDRVEQGALNIRALSSLPAASREEGHHIGESCPERAPPPTRPPARCGGEEPAAGRGPTCQAMSSRISRCRSAPAAAMANFMASSASRSGSWLSSIDRS
jgi:AAA ATPase domain